MAQSWWDSRPPLPPGRPAAAVTLNLASTGAGTTGGADLAPASQDITIDGKVKVRATLDALALETRKLADAGNANARVVVDELRKRGITINRPSDVAKK